MKKRKSYNRSKLLVMLCLTVSVVSFMCSCKFGETQYQHDMGLVFGTNYSITYQSDVNLKAEIEDALAQVDASLSPFNEKSVITAVNNNVDGVELGDMFTRVFTLAGKVYEDTEGAFDITVAPLVNAWGFGFKNGKMPDKHDVDSLLQVVGFDKVQLQDGKVTKKDERVMLDCSAIAKGFGVDVVADVLRKHGVENFMVEIGGEIVAAGVNPKNSQWRIGVTKPDDDSLNVSGEIQSVMKVSDMAMATSGNYRNFYYKDGKKFAHTIDPKTGYPIQHSLLSATVIAGDCATADAYATSFMVMGMDKAKQLLERHPEMMAYFIFADGDGNNAVWMSPALKEKVEE